MNMSKNNVTESADRAIESLTKTIELMAKQLEILSSDRTFLLQIALKQKHQIEHLELAVLSMTNDNARSIINGKMTYYLKGKQVTPEEYNKYESKMMQK